MNSILDAQSDMREGYFNGVPGIVSSGSAWLVAALVALLVGPRVGILTLIFGGMLIFPVATVLCKAIGCTGWHRKDNPLAPLAIAGTIWMILSIPIAVGAALFRIEWFFPAMLLVIGSRYLTFQTLYGIRTYWAFGAVLVACGIALALMRGSVFLGALAGALVEYAFAIIIFIARRSGKTQQGGLDYEKTKLR
jgi:hypothetical protein